jgi:hypothetical protein
MLFEDPVFFIVAFIVAFTLGDLIVLIAESKGTWKIFFSTSNTIGGIKFIVLQKNILKNNYEKICFYKKFI